MARLRNRIRKADYFTDGELLRWHRDKRATYSALWALAEDSGCLEDDPFTWKLLVWSSPLDSDITVSLLTEWRDELVEAGKLIPYEAEGKSYLFIRTFHQHELPRNPQPPDLPLPDWLRLETTEGVGKDGKRWVRYRYIDSKYTVRNRYGLCTDHTVDNSAKSNGGRHETSHGLRTDSVLTPLPCPALSCVPKGTKGQEGNGTGAVDNSTVPPGPVKKPLCDCGAELAYDGDGSPKMHCPVCGKGAA